MSTPKLSELVASRISHDILGPLGATLNGLELIELTGGGAEEMTLVASSSISASLRLRLYRIAFGTGGEDRISPAELTEIVQGIGGGKQQFIWYNARALSRSETKASFLLCLCIERLFPFENIINVSRGRSCLLEVYFNTSSETLTDIEAVKRAFSVPDWSPNYLEFHLLPDALQHIGKTLELELEQGQFSAKIC